MRGTWVLPSPAKVNLFLRILGRRPDGYHELQTLFQFLDIGDRLSFEENKKLELITEIPELSNSHNLIIKAAKLLQSATGRESGVRIILDKQLPVGGGVGGGSSNAATALIGLNAFWELGLTTAQLEELGIKLGADVPVFVRGQSAFAEGIGEKLTPMEPPCLWYVLAIPDVHVNTTELYQHSELPRNSCPVSKKNALMMSVWQNDFEVLARKLYPEVDKCFSVLDNFADISAGRAMLSGSGACVFIPFSSRETAEQIVVETRYSGIRALVVRGVNSSPLHRAVACYQGM
ncbi:4-diphosphocytidyl-2-C-methyl-D-erythritol kinase [invertebrate metagenome]|uniref:4-(cytidine 5'-diphospho)-2-C-methyl-D-erythritol kinase n=1 Tax=invertebrate metagenome TaxID=1711999 RepID=A0A2H9T907_9ZZZZ